MTRVQFFFFLCKRRFTGQLAKSAKHVTAVDFMEKFVAKNKILNAEHPNIDFLCADVTKLDLPGDRYI